jgi:hypothetical protein
MNALGGRKQISPPAREALSAICFARRRFSALRLPTHGLRPSAGLTATVGGHYSK